MPATYEPIATTTVSGTSTTTITFNSIPATYTDLIVILNCLGINGTGAVRLALNADNGSNYSRTYLYGDGSSASSSRETSSNYITLNAGVNVSSTVPSFFKIDLFGYAGSTNKTILADTSMDYNGSGIVNRTVGLWRSTSAINSVRFLTSGNYFNSGTTATLYGILKA